MIYTGIRKAIQEVINTNDDDMIYMVPVMAYHVDGGRAFVAAEIFPSLASGSSVRVLFENPSDSGVRCRLLLTRITPLANGRLAIYRNVSVTSRGSSIPTFNLNMEFSNESKATVEYNGTYDTTGITPLRDALPGGNKKEAIGSLVNIGEHVKIPPGKNIMYEITNISDSSADYSIRIVWIEEPITS